MKPLFYLLLIPCYIVAQEAHSHRLSRAISFPDVPGYYTLKCDLHQHTVFSDGDVWPTIRVQEALLDGLDAISITDHLEYQPHKNDIPHPDRNRSFEIALAEAKDHNLLVIRGSEITRKMPPGHSNAIFIKDANKLLIDDSVAAFKEAKSQGAFVFWNHPNWISQRKDGMATLTDMHKKLIAEKLLDGIEVVNEKTYSDEALQIALDNNLTIMGTSDIHGLVDWEFGIPKGGHRPITLVFAKEKTEVSLQDALVNRRTVVFFNNVLIGREAFLNPLIQSSLIFKEASYLEDSSVLNITIDNQTRMVFTLKNESPFTLHSNTDLITIKPGENNIQVKTLEKLQSIALNFEVLNAVFAPKKHPVLGWNVMVNQAK